MFLYPELLGYRAWKVYVGEMRVSNYLLWQGAYSEYLFVDTLWPDFRREEFIQALETYAKRDRRWGKIK